MSLTNTCSCQIKLEDSTEFETINEIVLETQCKANSKYYPIEAKLTRKKFGQFQAGPLKMNLKYNPFSQRASVAFYLDLIDCYYLVKAKPDYKNFIPYAIKSTRSTLEQNYAELKKFHKKLSGNNKN